MVIHFIIRSLKYAFPTSVAIWCSLTACSGPPDPLMLYGGRPGVFPPPGSRERLEMELERDKRERDAREREMRERELREIELMDKRRQELEMLPPGGLTPLYP